MFWTKEKNTIKYNDYELEYKKHENMLVPLAGSIRQLVADICIKNKALEMYLTDSCEYAAASSEILEKKKQLLKAMDEYTAQWRIVVNLYGTSKDHFVTLGKDRVTPLTARQLVENTIRYSKGVIRI